MAAASAANRQKNKNAAMAAMLVAIGRPHGITGTAPRPNSGGLTMTWGPGSSKNQRRTGTLTKKVVSRPRSHKRPA